MKKLLLLIALSAIMSGAVSAKITLPAAKDMKLENGMTISVISRPQLPLLSVQLVFRAGSTFDPVGKEGLASLANDMLMRGTSTRTAKQIADEIAFGGGTLDNSCGYVSAGLEGEFLSSQSEKAFEILADLVGNSTFPADEIDKTKTRAIGGLQSRLENPSNVAGDAIWSNLLGQSRYAHYSGGMPASVKGLTREEIVRFVKERYQPDNCILVICGDIAPSDVQKWAAKYFGKWIGKAVVQPEETSFFPVSGRQVVIYDKKDATQTQIRLGLSGIPLNHPDYPALEVARTIYGGSFGSRLVNEIRVNRGLTYNVGYRSSNLKPGGVAFVSTFTKNAAVGEVIDIILSEAARMQTEMVPDSDMTHYTNYRCGTYPLAFETNDDLAGVFADMWLDKLDKSYYQDYQERLRAVTQVQAMEVARKYFPKDNYRLVLVGKADDIMEQVKKYGPVTVLPFSAE
jgi:zinc protease